MSFPRHVKEFPALLAETMREFRRQKPHLIGAALAFYIIFSLGPIMFISLWIVGLVFGSGAESRVVVEIQNIVGPGIAAVLESFIENATSPPSRLITAIVSVPLVMFGATMIFFQIQNALHLIWEVETSPGRPVRGFVKNYLFSFMMVLVVGLVMIALIVKSSLLTLLRLAMIQYLSSYAGSFGLVLHILDFLLTYAAVTILFAVIYKYLPHTTIRLTDMWVGAAVTSILFAAGQFFIDLYIRTVDIGSAYGAIGSITTLFVWILYSSLIFLFGAVFTKQYVRKYGRFSHMENGGGNTLSEPLAQ